MSKMPYVAALILLFSAGLFTGCGSTGETQEEESAQELPPPPPSSPPPVKPAEPPVSFDVKTDTVVTAPPHVPTNPVVQERQPATRYLVQVGAFKDAGNATRIQNVTRERFRMTVLNDYNTLIGMYQIRVGTFESRDAAERFRNRIVKEYPREYKDAWIVELTQ